MTYKEAVKIVAQDLNLPQSMVNNIYIAYWKAIREHIKALPLKEDLTDEEFLNLRPNVNIPSLGKLCVTLESYRKKKETYKRQQIKNKEYVAH